MVESGDRTTSYESENEYIKLNFNKAFKGELNCFKTE